MEVIFSHGGETIGEIKVLQRVDSLAVAYVFLGHAFVVKLIATKKTSLVSFSRYVADYEKDPRSVDNDPKSETETYYSDEGHNNWCRAEVVTEVAWTHQ
jgi:hypothetical protein